MKKIIALLLVTVMCLSGLVACGDNGQNNEMSDLDRAIENIDALYKREPGYKTASDYTVVSQVRIDGTVYKITWTADSDTIKFVDQGDETLVDVDEKNPEELTYNLTATVSDDKGTTKSISFEYVVPAFLGYDKIVNDAYALQPGETLDGQFTLEGVILTVDTPFDPNYGNVTVTIQVGNLKDKPIQCYRLKGEGADTIKAGDTITVTGELTNYNGKIEFNQGCTLDNVVVGEDTTPPLPEIPANATMEQLVDISYQLVSGQKFETPFTLKGVITAVNTAFDANYGNVTVTIQVGDKADKLIECYRMKGEGADTIKVGDTITVTGFMKNYSGKIEFDAGCTLDKVEAAQGGSTTEPEKPADPKPEDPKPEDPKPVDPSKLTAAQIMDLVDALAQNTQLEGTYALTGIVLEVSEVSKYGDVNVTMEVVGAGGRTIYCYGVKGEGNTEIKVGDTITVEGTLKDYNGTKEFHLPQMTSRVPGAGTSDKPADKPTDTPANPTTQKEIVDAAFALAEGATLEGTYTLTGVISSFKNPPALSTYGDGTDWEAQLYITVEGKEILCYWLKGTEAQMKDLKVGDTITVSGTIKNFKGTVEFDKPRMQ